MRERLTELDEEKIMEAILTMLKGLVSTLSASISAK